MLRAQKSCSFMRCVLKNRGLLRRRDKSAAMRYEIVNLIGIVARSGVLFCSEIFVGLGRALLHLVRLRNLDDVASHVLMFVFNLIPTHISDFGPLSSQVDPLLETVETPASLSSYTFRRSSEGSLRWPLHLGPLRCASHPPLAYLAPYLQDVL